MKQPPSELGLVHLVLELLTELIDLGWDYLAVRVGVALQVPVVLVVVLSRPELSQLPNFSDYGIGVELLLGDLIPHLVGCILLLLVHVEDS